jgi:hypothetical protein
MKTFGLGDLVFYVLRIPVLAYDWLYGTDLRDCIKCKKRRKLWNTWFSMPAWAWLVFLVTIAGAVFFY